MIENILNFRHPPTPLHFLGISEQIGCLEDRGDNFDMVIVLVPVKMQVIIDIRRS
jgi:hypothetical protein